MSIGESNSKTYYEVDFKSEDMQYDYMVDAATGEVVESDKKAADPPEENKSNEAEDPSEENKSNEDVNSDSEEST